MVLNWGQFLSFPPLRLGGIWQCLETFLLLELGVGGVTSEQGPGMLLNILQCPGQLSTVKNDLTPNANSAEAEKPWFQLGACLDLSS